MSKDLMKEHHKEAKKITIEVNQSTLWKIGTLVFAVLFVVSIFTGGFRDTDDSSNDDADDQPTLGAPNQPSAPQQRVSIKADDDPVLGEKKADVTIVECTDYQCPFCNKAFTSVFPVLKKDYIDSGKLRYIIKDFPLPFHTEADDASAAANCAGAQGKYWEMHDKIFQNQASWSGNSDPATIFEGYAKELGLDGGAFSSCVADEKTKQEIDQDISECSAAGTSGTPTFYINGMKLVGAQPIDAFKKLIDAELNN